MSESKQLAHSLTLKERTKDVILTENVSFNSLILPSQILEGLNSAGFVKPSPIQVKALPIARCGLDVIVKSKSGTGKTLVFGIVSLESIKLEKPNPQVLIVVPTREISVQIQDVIQSIGKYYEGLAVQCFIGGLSLSGDKTNCKNCHIAVGTPGRVKQLIQDGSLNVDSVKILVLDEADKLVEESYLNDINEIYNSLPDYKQVLMCSATYPDETFLSQYTRSPVLVTAELESPLLLGLQHYAKLLKCPPNVVQQTKAKNDELLKLLSVIPFIQCLVFSNYQNRAESICNFLNQNGWNSIFMSAAQSQPDRLASLADLKDFKKKILVTTDLAARGIDAPNVDLVVNYDIPIDATTYLHRMGRAGRYGATGNCVNLTFSGQESKQLQRILGVIGGQNLSIPLLDDKYNLDISVIPKENCLFGEVLELNTNDSFDVYKKEISKIRSSLAETNKHKGSRNKKSKTKSVINNAANEKLQGDSTTLILESLASGTFELANCPAENSNGKSLSNKKSKLKHSKEKDLLNNVINKKLQEDSAVSVLQSLASGSFELDQNRADEVGNVSNTYKMLKRDQSSSIQPSKSNEDSLEVSILLQQLASEGEISEESTFSRVREKSPEKIVCKNKALFTVAKALSNVEVSKDDFGDLAAYISHEKTKESCNKICTDLNAEKNQLNYQETIENIFSLAYKSQVSQDAVRWQDLIPEEEKVKLSDDFASKDNRNDFEDVYGATETEDQYDEEEYDEDYNFEIEKDIEVNYDGKVNDYSFMEWIPVEPQRNKFNKNKNSTKATKEIGNTQEVAIKTSEVAKKRKSNKYDEWYLQNPVSNETLLYQEQYSRYYHHCGSSLWQNGLSFSNVRDFDNWFFNNWESQLNTVRNFVQNKIYMEEMSNSF